MSMHRIGSQFFRLILLWVVLPIVVVAQSSAINLSGKAVDPLSASRGRVVVLVFVRTDCPISNRYAVEIQRLSAEYSGKAAFWLIYPSKAESAEMIRKHERDFGYKLPALRDPQHVLVKQSEIEITPEAAVFDLQRRLVYHGRIDNLYEDIGRARTVATTHELDKAIQAALRGEEARVKTAPATGCYVADTK
jgi:AhpC/TSA family